MRLSMRGLGATLVALAACLIAQPAAACGDAGSATARILPAYRLDAPWYSGLAVSLQLGLLPASYPAKDIGKVKSPCRRADFQAAGKTWTLFGDKEAEGPPRWATAGSDRKRIVFLALAPHPEAAYAWARTRKAGGGGDVSFDRWVWVLGVTDGANRRIFALYDDLPTDARLIDDMQAALEGRFPVLTTYDIKKQDYSEDANFLMPMTEWTVLTKGKSAPDDNSDAARAAFRVDDGGRAVARASGLVCPPTLGGLQRSAISINGGDEGRREAICRYSGDRMRLAVVATRTPDLPAKDELLLATVFLAPEKVSDATDSPPALSGPEGELYVMTVATMPDGERRTMWFRRRGDWTIAIYGYYGPDAQPAITAAAQALADAQAGAGG